MSESLTEKKREKTAYLTVVRVTRKRTQITALPEPTEQLELALVGPTQPLRLVLLELGKSDGRLVRAVYRSVSAPILLLNRRA